MGMIEDDSLCGILVTNERQWRGGVRVGDLANLKTQRQKGLKGYDEIVMDGNPWWNSRVIVVKRGQNAVIEGKATLRLFMRVAPGTAEKVAMARAEKAWKSRKKVNVYMYSKWYEYFT